jgi:hypothetical protein
MIDETSFLAYKDLISSGRLGKSEAHFLYAFRSSEKPLTRNQAILSVFALLGIKYPVASACGRIKGLVDKGMLEKMDHYYFNKGSDRPVRAWRWTGRIDPLPAKKKPESDGPMMIPLKDAPRYCELNWDIHKGNHIRLKDEYRGLV